MHREASRGRMSGRTQEIQRLIGRSLRAVVDRKRLGERSIWIDCDVIQADGGTRTASITGAYVALTLAVDWMLKQQILEASPLIDFLAAISVGIVAGKTIPGSLLCAGLQRRCGHEHCHDRVWTLRRGPRDGRRRPLFQTRVSGFSRIGPTGNSRANPAASPSPDTTFGRNRPPFRTRNPGTS